MLDSDRPRFVQLMQALAASFRVDPTPALFEGYWLGLRSLEIDDFASAVAASISTSKRMPVPAELRENAGEAPVSMLAVQAWAKLRESAARHGAYASVDFGPVMNATIRTMGGWQRFCTEENNDFVRRDFEKTFSAYAAMGVGQEQGGYLVGLHELTNRANGFPYPKVVAIEGVPNVPNRRQLNTSSHPDIRNVIEGILTAEPR